MKSKEIAELRGRLAKTASYKFTDEQASEEREKIALQAIGLLESLAAGPQWIPVSERLPEVGVDVLFCMDGSIDIGSLNSRGLFDNDRSGLGETADAWMPLPKPFGEGKPS